MISSEATVGLDIRAIPDEDMVKFKELLTKVIDDPLVTVEANGNQQTAPGPHASSTGNGNVPRA